jgi:hypothetical protein
VFNLLDLALLFGLINLIVWILGIVGIFAIGNIVYIFLAFAVILLYIWFVHRIVLGDSYYVSRRDLGSGVV